MAEEFCEGRQGFLVHGVGTALFFPFPELVENGEGVHFWKHEVDD